MWERELLGRSWLMAGLVTKAWVGTADESEDGADVVWDGDPHIQFGGAIPGPLLFGSYGPTVFRRGLATSGGSTLKDA